MLLGAAPRDDVVLALDQRGDGEPLEARGEGGYLVDAPEHVLRDAGVFEVGESEGEAGVIGVDDITDSGS